jgi:heat shock protein HslJ
MRRVIAAPLLGIVVVAVTVGCTVAPVARDAPAPPAHQVAVTSPEGTWGQGATLTIRADGTFFGNAGCNHVGGTWKDAAGAVQFVTVASTQILCEDRADWSAMPARAVASATRLTLFDRRGEVITELARISASEDEPH